MNRLKPQLDPYRFLTLQFTEQIQNISGETVTSCSDGKCHDLLGFHCRRKKCTKPVHGGISVGVGLKIGDKFPAAGLAFNPLSGLCKLLFHRKSSIGGKISGAALTAESTAANAQRTIPVGTGHAAA